MVLSPDGRHVAVVDGKEVTVFDVATGRPVDVVETDGRPARASSRRTARPSPLSRPTSASGAIASRSGSPARASRSIPSSRIARRRASPSPPTARRCSCSATEASTSTTSPSVASPRLDRPGSGDSLLSPDGTLVASDHGSDVRLWDLKTGRSIHEERPELHSKVGAVTFSPDGTRLATSSDDRVVCLWEVATGRQVWSTKTDTFTLDNLAFSPDGRLLAGGNGYDYGRLTIWDAATGARCATSPADTRSPSRPTAAPWQPRTRRTIGRSGFACGTAPAVSSSGRSTCRATPGHRASSATAGSSPFAVGAADEADGGVRMCVRARRRRHRLGSHERAAGLPARVPGNSPWVLSRRQTAGDGRRRSDPPRSGDQQGGRAHPDARPE